MRPDIFRHIKEASELIREVAIHLDEVPVAKVEKTAETQQPKCLAIDMEELRGLVNGH